MAGVYQNPKNKRWYMRYDTIGPNGKRKQHMISCGANVVKEKQANAMLIDRLYEIQHGTYIDPDISTLSEYLNQWLERCRNGKRLADSTIESYECNLRNHILPNIGWMRLAKLKGTHLQSFFDALIGKLSPKTMKNIHTLLHSALQQAVRLDMISKNPADNIELPRLIRPDIKIGTEQDIMKLFIAIEKSKYSVPIQIILGTGIRRGEVVGLKWSDYDEKQHRLTIKRSISQTKGKIESKGTKSDKISTIKLPNSLVEILNEHRENQKQRRDFLKDEYMDDDWICAQDDGKMMTPGGLGKAYYEMAKKYGINVTLHGLRHTLTTLEIQSGVPIKIVSERRSHSTTSFTMDKYAHVMPNMQDEAVEVAERLFDLKTPKIKIAGE